MTPMDVIDLPGVPDYLGLRVYYPGPGDRVSAVDLRSAQGHTANKYRL